MAANDVLPRSGARHCVLADNHKVVGDLVEQYARCDARCPERPIVVQADERSLNDTRVRTMNAAREACIYDISLAEGHGAIVRSYGRLAEPIPGNNGSAVAMGRTRTIERSQDTGKMIGWKAPAGLSSQR